MFGLFFKECNYHLMNFISTGYHYMSNPLALHPKLNMLIWRLWCHGEWNGKHVWPRSSWSETTQRRDTGGRAWVCAFVEGLRAERTLCVLWYVSPYTFLWGRQFEMADVWTGMQWERNACIKLHTCLWVCQALPQPCWPARRPEREGAETG